MMQYELMFVFKNTYFNTQFDRNTCFAFRNPFSMRLENREDFFFVGDRFLVERWIGELTSKAVRRGSFASVADLEAAIAQFLEAWNENPNPFVWTATVESIQAKLARCRQTLEQIKPGCTAPRSRKKKIKSPVISRTPH